ncbi:MAG: class I SAM-dependent methyltransferase [Hyphomicrobiales bacterium]|nr:class I SAM-dependent methyltransferase [Hyphomicrobiales bacterium]
MKAEQAEDPFLQHFNNPDAVARYADGPPRYVPGYADLHRMTGVLLDEKTPENGRVLALGAGGGHELKALAEAYPGWTFAAIDPAAEMLKMAKRIVGSARERVEFCEGYIDDAPYGPFDAALCLLTLHFLEADERRRTASEIRRRLKSGAPFVAAHSSFPQDEKERDVWLYRYAAFAIASGADPEEANNARSSVAASLHVCNPQQDEAILREAGFSNVSMFYAAFTWRGWVGYA